jgi:hypothetical protein
LGVPTTILELIQWLAVQASMDRLWFLLTLIALVFFGVIEHGPIVRQWNAMYPSDPNERKALAQCYSENHQFNRANAEDRSACYDRWLPIRYSFR